jgi:hypothetical protein
MRALVVVALLAGVAHADRPILPLPKALPAKMFSAPDEVKKLVETNSYELAMPAQNALVIGAPDGDGNVTLTANAVPMQVGDIWLYPSGATHLEVGTDTYQLYWRPQLLGTQVVKTSPDDLKRLLEGGRVVIRVRMNLKRTWTHKIYTAYTGPCDPQCRGIAYDVASYQIVALPNLVIATNPPAKTSPPPPEATCPEVSCMTNPDGPCCPPKKRPPQPPADEYLTRDQIANTTRALATTIAACAKDKHGIVKAAVKVDATGQVTNVDLKESFDAAIGTCVADILRKAKFPATKQGGSFTMPFSL